jgi:TatD DNase family protein
MIDISVNLTHESLSQSIPDILKRATNCGVSHMIITGSSISASSEAIKIAMKSHAFFSTAGIHPHHANEFKDEDIELISNMLKHQKTVAIGECGLDFNRNFSSIYNQINCFSHQLNLAKKMSIPVFLHQRDAHEQMLAILDNYNMHLHPGVMHCFTEGTDKLRDYLDRGLYIGITGWISDLKRGQQLRESIKFLPLDRMMIETDAPYLLPKNLQVKPKGRINEPCFLPYIVREIALYKGCSVDEIISSSRKNTIDLFKLPIPVS